VGGSANVATVQSIAAMRSWLMVSSSALPPSRSIQSGLIRLGTARAFQRVESEFTNVTQMFAGECAMKCANPDFDCYGGPDVMNWREVRVPKLLRGSVLDARIGYHPVVYKSAYIDPYLRAMNSHQKLMPLVVRIKELLSGQGML
jgi:hypothetical protein